MLLVMPGGVLSMLIPVTVAVALVPAWLTAVPGTVCPVPSAVTVVGLGQVAMPDCASAQVKVTVTLLLFQPLPFAAVRTAVINGLVLSMLTVTVAVVVLPARSVAVPVTTW